MATSELTENYLFIILSRNPAQSEDLQKINLEMSSTPDRDVILDFSLVQVITSAMVSNLLILRGLLQAANRKLVICNISFLNKCVFTVCGLQEQFYFAANKEAALEILNHKNNLAAS
ncbi:MAG: hypothetical protein WDA68_03070 [Phycisphaerae bacterium]